jgi:hypothetical protein
MADFYLLTSKNLIAKIPLPLKCSLTIVLSNCKKKFKNKMAEIRQMAPPMFFTFPLMSPVALNRF